jgi:hypothetical protein
VNEKRAVNPRRNLIVGPAILGGRVALVFVAVASGKS